MRINSKIKTAGKKKMIELRKWLIHPQKLGQTKNQRRKNDPPPNDT